MVKLLFAVFIIGTTLSENVLAQTPTTITVGKGMGSGANNVIVGDTALLANTTGALNTAIGNYTMRFNTLGSYNNAFGAYSLWKNTTGGHNIGVGVSSLTFNTTGGYNTAVGSYSLSQNITGNNNTGLGYLSLNNNTTGSDNSAIGVSALQNNTTGSKNLAIGRQSLYDNSTGSNNIGIGYYAQPNDNVSDGQLSIQNIIFGVNNTGIGTTISTGNIGIGIKAPTEKFEVNGNVKATGLILTTSSGIGKILTSDAGGNASWQSQAPGWSLSGNSGTTSSNFLGTIDSVRLRFKVYNQNYGFLEPLTAAGSNMGIGYNSLNSITTGFANTAYGFQALRQLTTGNNNTFLGYNAGGTFTAGSFNVGVGVQCLAQNFNGDRNVAMGYGARQSNDGNSDIVAIGNDAVAASVGIALGSGAVAAANEFALTNAVSSWKFRGNSYVLPSVSTNGVLTNSSGTLSWASVDVPADSTFAKNDLTATGNRKHSWRNLYSFKMDSVIKTTFVTDTFQIGKLVNSAHSLFSGTLMNASNDIFAGILIERGSISNGDTTNYSKAYNSFDAVTSGNLYTVNALNHYVVERRPEILTPDTLVVGVGNGTLANGSWNIKFSSSTLSALITLHDNYLNTNTSISASSASTYTFTIDQNAASKGNRFILYFYPSPSLNNRLKVIISGIDSLASSTPNTTMLVMDGDTMKKARIPFPDTLILTTSGSSGLATYSGGHLNIPNYRTDSNWSLSNSGTDIYNNNPGNLGIGTQTPNSNAKLDVNGNIFTNGKIAVGETSLLKIGTYSLAVNGSALFNKAVVKLNATWPDYVFDKQYKMPSLQEVENYILTNQHLPEVPTAIDVAKNGIDLGNNATILLKKIEELTLFIISQNKEVDRIKQTIDKQSKDIDQLKSVIQELKQAN